MSKSNDSKDSRKRVYLVKFDATYVLKLAVKIISYLLVFGILLASILLE